MTLSVTYLAILFALILIIAVGYAASRPRIRRERSARELRQHLQRWYA